MGAEIKNTIVVIPSYNEFRTIGSIVRDVIKMGFSVLVIDDGSLDGTGAEAMNSGAIVVRNKVNMGKGRAIKEGFRYVVGKMNYEWMVIMDGDGQHDPADIVRLLETSVKDGSDIVVGNRMLDTKNMPLLRELTNRFMSWFISVICGQKIPDTQCGFRLLRIKVLQQIKLISDNYDVESELLIKASKKGFKISSAPVKTIYGNEISEIKPVRDTIRFFKLIIKYLAGGNE